MPRTVADFAVEGFGGRGRLAFVADRDGGIIVFKFAMALSALHDRLRCILRILSANLRAFFALGVPCGMPLMVSWNSSIVTPPLATTRQQLRPIRRETSV